MASSVTSDVGEVSCAFQALGLLTSKEGSAEKLLLEVTLDR